MTRQLPRALEAAPSPMPPTRRINDAGTMIYSSHPVKKVIQPLKIQLQEPIVEK
jgi:hypothetical protein